jgi:DNA-3-methyladenine glycosylase II
MRKAIQHLSKDKALSAVIKSAGTIRTKADTDLFLALLRSIVGQQLSMKAAQTIWNRFLDLFPDRYPHASLLLKLDDARLRSAGLSGQKAGYLRNIATFSIEKSLDYERLKRMTDDELVDYLVQIKGVGRWTAEMILMFSLGRMDVFPIDDLGIQNGMRKLYRIRSTDKKKLFSRMEAIANNWRPYRTVACMYVWRFKDTPAK